MNYRRIIAENEVCQFILAWEYVFKRKLSQDVYDWIFAKRNNIYACFDEGKVVAGYCLLDIESLGKTEYLKGGLCNNVFVSGYKYQKMGVFGELANYALNDICTRGYSFALGFPNKKAIKAHLRSGWSQEESLPFYEFREWHNVSLSEGKLQFRWFSRNQDLVFKDIYTLMKSKCGEYSFSILRDSDFLNWRFGLNQRWDYDICGVYNNNQLVSFFVSKYFEERKRIHLVDYYFNSPHSLEIAIGHIYKKYYIGMGLNLECIDAWCAKGDQESFKVAGFSEASDFSYVIFRDLTKKGLKIGLKPHLTLADNDVY